MHPTQARQTSNCLSDDEVLALALGTTVDFDRDAALHHVDECAACRGLLARSVLTERPAGATPLPGMVWAGRYVIAAPLGRGAMGEVYRAWDVKLERHVALKVLAVGRWGDEVAMARLIRESKAMARLSHPHAVTVYDSGEYGGRPFVAMELVHGQTMERWAIDRPWRDLVRAYADVADALAAAHRAGLIHRDVKPANILVGDDAVARVSDFGLAHMPTDALPVDSDLPSSEDISLTATGAIVGTPAFMAPEQLARAAIDARADVFSLCAALYHSCFGVVPFAAHTIAEVCAAQAAGRIQDPPRRSSIPQRVRATIIRGLAADPRERYSDMAELRDALVRLLQRRRWPLVATAATLATTVAGVAAATLREMPPACETPAAIDEVWSPQRREALAQALADDPYLHARIDAAATRYVDAWRTTHAETCSAEVPATGERDAVLACLRNGARQLLGVVDAITRVDDRARSEALLALAQARSPAECTDPNDAALYQPQPVEPELQRRAASIRDDVAVARGLWLAARHDVAREQLRDTLRSAESTGYRPLMAEVWHAIAEMEFAAERFREAFDADQSAIDLATAGGHDVLAMQAWTQLISTADRLGDVDRVQEYDRRAEAALARVGDNAGSLEVRLLHARGIAAIGRADAETARKSFTAELDSPASGVEERLHALGGLAAVASLTGDHAAAVTKAREVLRLRVADLGPDHPLLATSYINLAIDLLALARFAEAMDEVERGLAVMAANSASESPSAGRLLNLKGVLLLELGRRDESLQIGRQAAAVLTAALGPNHEATLDARAHVVHILAELGDVDGAIEAMEALADAWVQLRGDQHPSTATTRMNLAMMLLARGRAHDAIAPAAAALEALAASHGPRSTLRGHALMVHGQALRRSGDVAQGLTQLRLAREILAESHADPDVLRECEGELAAAEAAPLHAAP